MANADHKSDFNKSSSVDKKEAKTEKTERVEQGFERLVDNYVMRAAVEGKDEKIRQFLRMKSNFKKEKIKEQDNAAKRGIHVNMSVKEGYGTSADIFYNDALSRERLRKHEASYKKKAKELYKEDLSIANEFDRDKGAADKSQGTKLKSFLQRQHEKAKDAKTPLEKPKEFIKERYNMASKLHEKPPLPKAEETKDKKPLPSSGKSLKKTPEPNEPNEPKNNGIDIGM